MIKNELQYKRTNALAIELKHSLENLRNNEEYSRLPKLAQKAHLASVKRQLAQLEEELEAYESLKNGQFDFSLLPSIEKIPIWLIQARIARGLGQEELARMINLKKQQIQQYEATEYASASLTRILQVAEALQRYDSNRPYQS